MMKMVLNMASFITLLLFPLCTQAKELSLKSRFGDVIVVAENRQLSLVLNLTSATPNPLTAALEVAGIFSFINTFSEQIVDFFDQINEQPPDVFLSQFEIDFQSQLQRQLEEHVQNYVQQHLRRIYGSFGWMLHTGILCACLYLHSSK